jgi:hypothetical protein
MGMDHGILDECVRAQAVVKRISREDIAKLKAKTRLVSSSEQRALPQPGARRISTRCFAYIRKDDDGSARADG